MKGVGKAYGPSERAPRKCQKVLFKQNAIKRPQNGFLIAFFDASSDLYASPQIEKKKNAIKISKTEFLIALFLPSKSHRTPQEMLQMKKRNQKPEKTNFDCKPCNRPCEKGLFLKK